MLIGLALIIGFLILQLILIILHRHAWSFNKRTLLALVLGLGYGLLVQQLIPLVDTSWTTFLLEMVCFFGSAYLALLKMLVIPLVLTSIVYSILRLGDIKGVLLSRLASGSVGMLLGMTALASGIGIAIGSLFHVGEGMQLSNETMQPQHQHDSIVNTLVGMIPSNPVKVMSQENTVALVIFAVFIGVATVIVHRQDHQLSNTFKKFMESAFYITKKMAVLVIALTPYGVLGLMTKLASHQGLESLEGLADFIGAMYTAIILVILMHTAIICLVARKNPLRYFQNAYQALLVGFTTRSSFGSLPVTEETLTQKFKMPQMVGSFVPSLGATIGMNACAGVFPAMLVVMAMHIQGAPITLPIVFEVMGINMLASLGVSGIPGTAFIAAGVTLTTMGLPYGVVGIVQGIDPIIDMGRTATNINGTMTTALTVNHFLPTDINDHDDYVDSN